jgi:hypothetical protein
MAAIGRSMSPLSFCQMRPTLGLRVEISAICPGRKLRTVASMSEQHAEITNAPRALAMSNHIAYSFSFYENVVRLARNRQARKETRGIRPEDVS